MRFTNQYRDGLAIAMLISMPLRISNFGGLQLDKSIQRIGDRYWIFVEKTKNGRPMEFALPLQLTQPIDLYLEQHRPYLLARGKHTLREAAVQAFWISSDGTALTSQLLGKRISDRTRDAFGRSVNPHLFRDAAATAIASEDPEHVGIILPILGHASLRVSEKHYNHAQSLQSARRYQEVLQGIVDSVGE